MVMCVYEGPIHDISKTTADFKLISDIKDAVNILTDEKLKLNDISNNLVNSVTMHFTHFKYQIFN